MSKEFSVFSLNLRFGLAEDGSNNWSRRKTLYPALLNKYISDFMCFQEVNDFQAKYLNTLLPNYYFIGQRKPAPEFWQSNVIFYHKKWECIEKQHFFLSHTPDIPSKFKESRWPRQCTIGVFKSDHHKLICVNTHFDFAPEVQKKSAVLIMQRLSNWPETIPTILVGDFNADTAAACYQTFTQSKDCEQDFGNSSFYNTFSQPYPGTHHSFTGVSGGHHIDWILYKGPLAKKDARIIKDDFNGRYPSDHFPLRAVFDFDGKEKSL